MNRNLDNVKSPGKGRVMLCGLVNIASDATVTSTVPASTDGAIFAATKPSGTGLYRLTFANDKVRRVLSAQTQVIAAAGTKDMCAEVVAITDGNNALVVDFQTRKKSDGTAVDNSVAAIVVSFLIYAENSSVNP